MSKSQDIEVITAPKTVKCIHTKEELSKPVMVCPVCYNNIELLPEDFSPRTQEENEISEEALTKFTTTIQDFLSSHNKFKEAFFNYRKRKEPQVK